MPKRIKLAKERIIVSKLAIQLIRFAAVELSAEIRGASSDDVLLLLAAYVGQAEGRKMTAAKIALYTGTARPTAVRKLMRMKRNGLVTIDGEGKFACSIEMLNADAMMRAVDSAISSIHSAAAGLSKLDIRKLAKP